MTKLLFIFALLVISESICMTNLVQATQGSKADIILSFLNLSSDAAGQAVNAYASAVSNCDVSVSCDEAKRRFGRTQTLVNIASSAFSTSVAASAAAKDINGAANEEALLQSVKDTTDLMSRQTALTLKATANALANCEVVINIICDQCPGGLRPTNIRTNRANSVLNSIKDMIKDYI